MSFQRRRVVWYVSALVGVVVHYTFVYQAGMAVFEDRSVSTLHSLVIEDGDTLIVAGTDDAMHVFTALARD